MLFQTCVALGAVLSLAQAKPTPTVLQYDDVIVAGKDGSVVVMKDYEYELKEARETLQRRKADAARSADQPESHVNHRRCDESVEYQVLSVSEHLNSIVTRYIVGGTCQIHLFGDKFQRHIHARYFYLLSYSLLITHVVGHELQRLGCTYVSCHR